MPGLVVVVDIELSSPWCLGREKSQALELQDVWVFSTGYSWLTMVIYDQLSINLLTYSTIYISNYRIPSTGILLFK